MHQWYYSTHPERREGPVSEADLLRAGLPDHALVWREGMAGWEPWAQHRSALSAPVPTPVDAASGDPFDPAQEAAAETASAAAGWQRGAEAGASDPMPSSAYREQAGAWQERRSPAAHDARPGAWQPASEAAGRVDNPYAAPAAPLATFSDQIHHGGEVVYAGFWKRVAAVVIDAIIVGVASYAIQLPLLLFAGIGGAALGGDPGGLAGGGMLLFFLVSYGIGVAIPLLYTAFMHASRHQATLGKMAVGIKVVDGGGARIGFWRAFGRYFAYILSSLTLLIGLIMAAFTDRKRALHDMICDTLVVDKWAYTDRPQWQRRELGGVTIAVLVIAAGLLLLALVVLVAAGMLAASGRF